MTDTQAQEAARLATASDTLADEREMIHLCSWVDIRNLLRADAALLRSQAARIAELERERERERELARMREPLSDEQIDALRVESAKAMQSLADRGLIPAPEVCDEDLVRRVEAAHGITKTGGGA